MIVNRDHKYVHIHVKDDLLAGELFKCMGITLVSTAFKGAVNKNLQFRLVGILRILFRITVVKAGIVIRSIRLFDERISEHSESREDRSPRFKAAQGANAPSARPIHPRTVATT